MAWYSEAVKMFHSSLQLRRMAKRLERQTAKYVEKADRLNMLIAENINGDVDDETLRHNQMEIDRLLTQIKDDQNRERLRSPIGK